MTDLDRERRILHLCQQALQNVNEANELFDCSSHPDIQVWQHFGAIRDELRKMRTTQKARVARLELAAEKRKGGT